MSSLSVYKDRNPLSTSISNIFIDEYITEANAAELKVYLYLLRVMESRQNVSVSELADRFNYTESDIIRSLKFWEKKGLMKLDFDSSMNLTGVRFIEPDQLRANTTPATIVPLNLERRVLSPTSAPAAAAISEDANSENAVIIPQKHTFTPSEMKLLRQRDDVMELTFVAESYIGRPLKSSDLQTLLYISEDLQFSKDLIDYLIEFCVEQGSTELRYIESVAKNWFCHDIHTPKAAAKYNSKYDKLVLSVMEALGRTTTPTPAEADYVFRWSGEYGFSKELILEACGRASVNTPSSRFKYTEGILQNWKKDGITNAKQLLEYEASKRTKKAAAPAKFNQHIQTGYDFDALEREILSN